MDVATIRIVLIAGDGFPGLATHTPLPTYWAAKLLTHWARGGAEILAATTSYPWLTVHAARADIYRARRDEELSLMAKGVFGQAAAESEAIAAPEG